MESPLLEVRNLTVSFERDGQRSFAVDDIGFSISHGERLALVGESGSGKSMTAKSLLALTRWVGAKTSADSEVRLEGENILNWPERRLRRIRGNRIAMIFQDPQSSLNPLYTVGRQIEETIHLHEAGVSRKDASRRAIDLLEQVGIQRPEKRIRSFPHEFSGGMRQRAMIAMALAGRPSLLVADEPTTALDVTVQQQIIALLDELARVERLAVLLISHDLGVVAGFSERVLVMYAGRIIEDAPTSELFHRPKHPYTAALLSSLPTAGQARSANLPSIPGAPPEISNLPAGCAFHPRCAYRDEDLCISKVPDLGKLQDRSAQRVACHYSTQLSLVGISHVGVGEGPDSTLAGTGRGQRLLQITDLEKVFRTRHSLKHREEIRAVDGVTFDVFSGEAFGIVGESGSGKSTVARCITRIIEPTGGRVKFLNRDLLSMGADELRSARRQFQMIFQDPAGALDMRLRVHSLLAEPLRIHGLWGKEGYDEDALITSLERVGLDRKALGRYPHEFSGGQRQRIAIARALVLKPQLVICDEPVSALDVSIRAGIINLLSELRRDLDLSYVFIAHDLSLVRHLCDRLAVMKSGKIVEMGPTAEIYQAPKHAYTKSLLSAEPLPNPDTERQRIQQAYRKVPT